MGNVDFPSESAELAASLRRQRTTTQAQVDKAQRTRDLLDIPAQVRFQASQAHTAAAPSAH